MSFPKIIVLIDEDSGVNMGTLYKVIRNPSGEDIPVYDFKVYYHHLDTLIRDEVDDKAHVEDVDQT